jgi:hypothetical protein
MSVTGMGSLRMSATCPTSYHPMLARKDVAEVRGDTTLFRSVASESGGRPV